VTAFVITDEEMTALAGLPHASVRLYLLGLRPHMDYATGVVGAKRRISWQMLREVLYVEPHRGLEDSGTPTLGKTRRALEWLIKAGLIEDIGTKERGEAIVFRCVLAYADESVQKIPGKNPARTRQANPAHNPAHNTASANADSDAGFNEIPGKEPGTNPDIPQSVDNSKYPAHLRSPLSVEEPPSESLQHIGRAEPQKSRFEDFWSAYPKKVGKAAAQAKWKSKRLDAKADELIADIQLRAGSDRKWLEGYIPNPLTYLSQERWHDEIERISHQPRNGKPSTADINRANFESFGRRLAAAGGS